MGSKEQCPGCGGYTSAIGEAFGRGENCPSCGLPAKTALEVLAVRQSRADKAIRDLAEEAAVRAGRAETRAAIAEYRLEQVRDALDASLPEGWQPDR